MAELQEGDLGAESNPEILALRNICTNLASGVYPGLFSEPAAIFWIEYSELSRRILLNGKKLLAKPNFCSENEMVFTYLYQNPGRRINIKELEEKATGEPIKKNLHEIIRDLRFKGDLAHIFFDVSKTSIRFRKSVASSELSALGLAKDKIESIYLS